MTEPGSENPQARDYDERPLAPQIPLRGVRRFRIEGAGKEHMEMARSRTIVAVLLFVCCTFALGIRLFDLGLVERVAETASRGDGRGTVLAARADIVDRNGVVLATNLTTASLYADPKRVLDPEEAADRLLLALPSLNRADLVNKFRADNRFVWIKRNLTPDEQWRVNSLGIPGLGFENEDRRVYPHGRLAAHVLGFVDIDGQGLAGIERFYNSRLANPGDVHEPLRLALDLRVQHVLHDELRNAVETYSAIGAAGLVLDVNNGEVLGLVSLPDFDPNEPGSANTETLFNRVVQGVYELGSGMKALTVAMALDSGAAHVTSSYDATKPLRVARFTINDYHPEKRWLSLPEVFMVSSNIGTARMAMDIGTETQRRYLADFGLLEKPQIELREAASPLVPSPWRDINTMTIGFGHGIAVTPLQLATSIGAVVNGGRLIPATLVQDSDAARAAAAAKQVVSPKTSDIMRKLLRITVMSGTGGKADVPGYEVGGKTGSAEKPSAGGYRRKALLSSFIAVFPSDAPRYAVLVIVDEPKGTRETFGFATGGWTAAPAAGNVIARIGPMLGVAPRLPDENQKARLRHALLLPVNDE